MRDLAALFLLFLMAFFPAAASADIRQELLQLINRERQKAGAPPVNLSPALGQAAQWHSGEIARRGKSLRLSAGSTEALAERMKQSGYDAHEWAESLQATTGDANRVLRNLREGDAGIWRKLLDPQFRDLGIGLDRLDGVPLYVFLYAVPEAEHFSRQTRGLGDLAQVRAAMLAAANAERKRAGSPPLAANPKLDLAAQRHAADMLARHYFAHESPEGHSVRERSKDAGYAWRAIGENIAEGQTSVAEVMKTWMNSPGHRRNILDRDFKEFGSGLALGKSGGRYRVEWVQTFGTRQ